MSDIASNDGWSEADSENFIDYGRYYVPEREQQIETICSLIPDTPPPSHVVELCCGEGLLSHALLERLPNATVHAFDGSPKMLAHTRTRLAQFGDRFDTTQFDLAASDWRAFPWPLTGVVSSLAIHHLDGPGKAALFADVARALAPGGVFVVACQWRSKKGPPRRCKKGPLGGCGLVPVVHGRAPRATRRALNRLTRRRAREGPVGPRGQAWAGWSVQLAVGV